MQIYNLIADAYEWRTHHWFASSMLFKLHKNAPKYSAATFWFKQLIYSLVLLRQTLETRATLYIGRAAT